MSSFSSHSSVLLCFFFFCVVIFVIPLKKIVGIKILFLYIFLFQNKKITKKRKRKSKWLNNNHRRKKKKISRLLFVSIDAHKLSNNNKNNNTSIIKKHTVRERERKNNYISNDVWNMLCEKKKPASYKMVYIEWFRRERASVSKWFQLKSNWCDASNNIKKYEHFNIIA